MKFLEKVLIVISVIALVLLFNQYSGSTELLFIALTLLSWIYFLLGFVFFSDLRIRQVFKGGLKTVRATTLILAFFSGLGLSIVCIGILFKLLHYAGADQMLLAGAVVSSLCLIINFIIFLKAKSSPVVLSLSRLLPFTIVAITLLLNTSESLFRYRYRKYPSYADAHIEYMKNPNADTERKRDVEYMRMILSPQEFEVYQQNRKK